MATARLYIHWKFRNIHLHIKYFKSSLISVDVHMKIYMKYFEKTLLIKGGNFNDKDIKNVKGKEWCQI